MYYGIPLRPGILDDPGHSNNLFGKAHVLEEVFEKGEKPETS
jgi:hypothetical protein